MLLPRVPAGLLPAGLPAPQEGRAAAWCLTIVPGETPCLRCVFEEAPPPEMNPTCDTAGVLATVVNIVASLQATEAVKLLTGQVGEINRQLVHVDVWAGRFIGMNVRAAYEQGNCPCCKQRKFEYLSGQRASTTTTLCGRNAVQVNLGTEQRVDFAAIAEKLEK